MNANELKEGKVYFMCMYTLPDIPIPEITPYVYLYKDASGYHFQHPKKYLLHQATKNIPAENFKEIALLVTQSDIVIRDEEDFQLFSTHDNLKEFISNLTNFESYRKWYV